MNTFYRIVAAQFIARPVSSGSALYKRDKSRRYGYFVGARPMAAR
ncbi:MULTISPECIES: hypothetical protein [Pantoea]|nr:MULTISPECIES: hypothetical protein [Pantoea]